MMRLLKRKTKTPVPKSAGQQGRKPAGQKASRPAGENSGLPACRPAGLLSNPVENNGHPATFPPLLRSSGTPSASPGSRPTATAEGGPPFIEGRPQLLRARHVMALLGVSKGELRKFIECDLLTPRYLPDPHRLRGRNARQAHRAWFLAGEVQAVFAHLKPRPS